MLLQSCVVYQKTSVPLNEAKDKGKARVVKTDNTLLYVKNIEKIDSLYYEVKGKKKIILSSYEIKNIFLKDEKASKVLTITAPLILIGFFAI